MDNRSFVYLVLAVLGLRCCMAFFLVMENGILIRAFLVAQRLKRLPTMRETRVRSLGREDPLEEEVVAVVSLVAEHAP